MPREHIEVRFDHSDDIPKDRILVPFKEEFEWHPQSP
jgi:hypothetical protein